MKYAIVIISDYEIIFRIHLARDQLNEDVEAMLTGDIVEMRKRMTIHRYYRLILNAMK